MTSDHRFAGGTANYVTLTPPQDSVAITHPSGKDISHYVVFYGPKVVPPTDVCPNIPGIQESVPPGMVQDENGNCLTSPPS